jgi:hypothetical protein
MLLVATSKPVPQIKLKHDDWELEVTDADEPSEKRTLSTAFGSEHLPLLIERSLYGHLATSTDFWTLDSPRIWYAAKPFHSANCIDAYRRYEIAAIPIDGVGIGIAVDVSTAFFSSDTLGYFFDVGVSGSERKRRREQFERLTERQKGQKGTLLYDNSEAQVKCYFEQAPEGITTLLTGTIRAKGKSFDHLAAYYEQTYFKLQFNRNGPAVRVSFPGIERPVWAAAERLKIRVMNDALPRQLQSVDKLQPAERRNLVQAFWRNLGTRPLGNVAPGVASTFWRPPTDRVHHLPLVDLTFGKKRCLVAPTSRTSEAYNAHYRQRAQYLEKSGSYNVPMAMSRVLYIVFPTTVAQDIQTQLMQDLTQCMRVWTSIPVECKPIVYTGISDAIEKLRADARSGMVVFVLNDEPVAYYDVAFHLEGWRIKRITEHTLHEKYGELRKGAWNPKTSASDLGKGKRRWQDFVEKSGLDVLQQLDVMPFRINQAGPYEAMLVIDVGHDRRHWALSLLVARAEDKTANFAIVSNVHPKPDHQHDAINRVVLAEEIVKLCKKALPHRADPLATLLVLRDGKFCGQECVAVDQAITQLKQQGKVSATARVDLVDLRKESTKSVRLWDVDTAGVVTNPLEGTLLELNRHTVVITSTGAATLTQGTADPYMLVSNGHCSDLIGAGQATFAAAQLNFSSPTVAQRLMLPLKRTDEELSARAAQEIKRLR